MRIDSNQLPSFTAMGVVSFNHLHAPSPSTIRKVAFEWRVADSATRSTEPTGRFFDCLS